MLNIGNINYFIGILFALGSLFGLYFGFRNKDEKTKHKLILVLLFLNFGLHLVKVYFPPYVSELPSIFRKITFENICAISTIVYPFVYLSKNKYLNTYLFFISLVGGMVAVAYPMEVLNKPMWCFDTLRFYYCHITLLIVPILLGCFKMFKPEFKYAWLIPVGFIIVSTIIFVNEIILIKIGFVSSSVDAFFDRSIRNSSFVFGPLPAFDGLMPLFKFLTPFFLRTNYFHFNVDMFYFPVLWLIVPCFVTLPFVYLLISLPFNLNKIKSFIGSRKEKRT